MSQTLNLLGDLPVTTESPLAEHAELWLDASGVKSGAWVGLIFQSQPLKMRLCYPYLDERPPANRLDIRRIYQQRFRLMVPGLYIAGHGFRPRMHQVVPVKSLIEVEPGGRVKLIQHNVSREEVRQVAEGRMARA